MLVRNERTSELGQRPLVFEEGVQPLNTIKGSNEGLMCKEMIAIQELVSMSLDNPNLTDAEVVFSLPRALSDLLTSDTNLTFNAITGTYSPNLTQSLLSMIDSKSVIPNVWSMRKAIRNTNMVDSTKSLVRN